MPLGTSSGYNSGPLVLLNTRGKDADGNLVKPYFTADRGIGPGGALVRDEQTYDNIGGDLFRAEVKHRQFTPKGAKRPQNTTDWVLYLRDEQAGYRLPLGQNGTSRDLLNRFARLLDSGDFTGLEIGYYRKKGTPDKPGREAFSLKQRGVRVDWKYTLEDLPQPRKVIDQETGEFIKNDYTALDQFFNDIVVQIAAALGQRPAAEGVERQAAATEQAVEQQAADEQGAEAADGQSALGEGEGSDGGNAIGETNAGPEGEPDFTPPPPPAPARVAARPAARPVARTAAPATTAKPVTAAPAPKATPAPAANPVKAATTVAPRPAAKTVTAPVTAGKGKIPF